MKRHFDSVIHVWRVAACAVAMFCVLSCTTNESVPPGGDDPELKTEISLAEAAGKAHNRALDILFEKLHGAQTIGTRSGGDEAPLDTLPESPYVTEMMVRSIVESLKELELGYDTAAIHAELSYYMDYCEQNPDTDPQLIPWSYAAEYCLNDAAAIIRKINNSADVDALISEIQQLESKIAMITTKEECLTFIIGTCIMRSSLRYWYDNYSRWFPHEYDNKWASVARTDCEWAIGVLKGEQKFRDSGWMTNMIGALTYGAKQIFTCACATAGSMLTAMTSMTNPHETDEDIEYRLQYEYSYTIAHKSLNVLIDLPFEWAGDGGEEEEP